VGNDWIFLAKMSTVKTVPFDFSGSQGYQNAKIVDNTIEPSLRDIIRVVTKSDSACAFTKAERSKNAGFTKSRRVTGEHVNQPLLGGERVDQDGGAYVAI